MFACRYQQPVYQLDAKLCHTTMQYAIKYELNLFTLERAIA